MALVCGLLSTLSNFGFIMSAMNIKYSLPLELHNRFPLTLEFRLHMFKFVNSVDKTKPRILS